MSNNKIDSYCLNRGYNYNNNNNNNNNIINGSNLTIICPGAGTTTFVAENMKQQIPVAYAIWKIVTILVITILIVICIRQIISYVKMQKIKNKSYNNVNLMKQVILLLAAILRWVWLLDPHYNSRIWPAPLFGTKHKTYAAIVVVLITIPQIFFMMVLNFEIQLWRSVIHKSKKMQSIRHNNTAGNCCRLSPHVLSVIAMVPLVIIFFFILVCTFISEEEKQGCQNLWNIYSFTLLFYIITFSMGGTYYTCILDKMIKTLKSFKIKSNITISQKHKALNKLNRIRQTVIALTITGWACLISYIFRVLLIDICCDRKGQQMANYGFLINISVIHFGEAIILDRLLNTIKTVDYDSNRFQTLGSDSAVKTTIQTSMVNLELTSVATSSPSNTSVYENDAVALRQ